MLTDFIRSVEAINDGQRTEMAELAIDQAGGDVGGKRIAVLGAAFKPGTDDTRNSPALTVADRLHASAAPTSGSTTRRPGCHRARASPRSPRSSRRCSAPTSCCT